MKKDTLPDDRERNEQGLNFLRSRAHDWASKALVRKKDGHEFAATNLSGRSLGALERAAYLGLVKIEEQVEKNPRLCTETQRDQAAKLADQALRGQLITLVDEGQDVFLNEYRKILKSEKPYDEVAVSGIRVMAHELGIETSLRKVMRARVQAAAEEQFRQNNASATGWISELIDECGNNSGYSEKRLDQALTGAFQAFSKNVTEKDFISEAKGEEISEMALGCMRFLIAGLLEGGKESYRKRFIQLPAMNIILADSQQNVAQQYRADIADRDQALALIQPAARVFAHELGIELPRHGNSRGRIGRERAADSPESGRASR